MTSCSTPAAPLMTPLAMQLLAGEQLEINLRAMIWPIMTMIVVPVVLGLVVNRYVHDWVTWAIHSLPPGGKTRAKCNAVHAPFSPACDAAAFDAFVMRCDC